MSNLQNITTPKTLELGTWNSEAMFTTPKESRVTCHLSSVTCQMSHVACHMSHVTCHTSNLQNSVTLKPIELGAWNFETMFTKCYMLHVTCHMSLANNMLHVTCHSQTNRAKGLKILRQCSPPHICHVTHVTCHMSHVTCHMLTTYSNCYIVWYDPRSKKRKITAL